MASLLILTQPLQKIVSRLPKVLAAASKHASERLYVHLDCLSLRQCKESKFLMPLKSRIISSIYSISPIYCPNLEVRILLYGFKKYSQDETYISTHEAIDQLLIDTLDDKTDFSSIKRRYKSFVMIKPPRVLLESPIEVDTDSEGDFSTEETEEDRTYDYVAVGGTFDRIHPGHKILLSECVLRTSKTLTVGIADGPLLKKKLLKELIEPCSLRVAKTKHFLTDVDNCLDYDVVPIEEPLGPTGWDPKIQMLVVSEETRKGIDLINNHRSKSGLSQLESYVIPIIEDCCWKHQHEETKFSSSSMRKRILGSKLHPTVPNKKIPGKPLVIGLTGGSASGKTKIAETLGKLGAGVIDCDKLGHSAYLQGTNCYFQIIQNFGKEVVNADGEINRKALSSVVFQDKSKLHLLNGLVWPEIYKLALVEIQLLKENGSQVVVLDAAVLLEAGWNKYCHEVWVCIINQEEAIKRIMERDQRSFEEATMRLQNQMTNEERVSKANVVFCTQWDYEYTGMQVKKAFASLKQYDNP